MDSFTKNHIWFQFSARLSKYVQLCRKRSLHDIFCSWNMNLEERALTILSLKSNCFFPPNNHNDVGYYTAPPLLVQLTYVLHVKEKWMLQLLGHFPHLTLHSLNLTHIWVWKGSTENSQSADSLGDSKVDQKQGHQASNLQGGPFFRNTCPSIIPCSVIQSLYSIMYKG